MKYKQTITGITVHPDISSPSGEGATLVSIDPEGFVKLYQIDDRCKEGIILIDDLEEFDALRLAAKTLLDNYDKNQD